MKKMKKILTYGELIQFDTFEDRFRYLKLNGVVGGRTFGSDRYLNQALYHSKEWEILKAKLILRDDGCDLAFPGRDISDRVYLHHLNPICKEDIIERRSKVLDPNNLVCVSFRTHQAIHYGDEDLLMTMVERKPGDTKLW